MYKQTDITVPLPAPVNRSNCKMWTKISICIGLHNDKKIQCQARQVKCVLSWSSSETWGTRFGMNQFQVTENLS